MRARRGPRPAEAVSSSANDSSADNVGLSRRSPVGCSFDGSVTMQCVLDHPGLAAAVVLVNLAVQGVTPPPSNHFATSGNHGMPAADAP